MLVSYEDPYPSEHRTTENGNLTNQTGPATFIRSDPASRAEVIRSLITAQVRSFTLSKTSDDLETPEAFEAMAQTILENVNPPLESWQLRVHGVNVEGVKLPDEVVADRLSQLREERHAETQRRLQAMQSADFNKKIQTLLKVAEIGFTNAIKPGVRREQRAQYVLKQVVTEMKNHTASENDWPATLDALLAELDNVQI